MAVGAVVEVNYVRRAHAQTVWPLLLSSSSLRSRFTIFWYSVCSSWRMLTVLNVLLQPFTPVVAGERPTYSKRYALLASVGSGILVTLPPHRFTICASGPLEGSALI